MSEVLTQMQDTLAFIAHDAEPPVASRLICLTDAAVDLILTLLILFQ
jgi:hypothetical protein